MKEVWLSELRAKDCSLRRFRECSWNLSFALALEISRFLEKDYIEVESPLERCDGQALSHPITLLPVLRSGIAMLEPFLKVFPEARVGFVGLERNEETAVARGYYEKIPKRRDGETTVILEPMLATGGSAVGALRALLNQGCQQKDILIAAVVGAPEGLLALRSEYPETRIVVAQEDRQLSSKKYILPGLGDFGDRYFGTDS